MNLDPVSCPNHLMIGTYRIGKEEGNNQFEIVRVEDVMVKDDTVILKVVMLSGPKTGETPLPPKSSG